jgi:hypothetical protein
MLPNDNEFDQLFRDRLRDHSSPVPADLWRRVHTGIGSTARRLRPWRSLRYVGGGAATLIVALAAAHYVYVLHSPSHRVAPTANHYSTINSGTRSADSGQSAVAADQAADPGVQSAALPGNHLNPGSDSNRGEFAPIKPGSIAEAPREGVSPTGTRSGPAANLTAAVGHSATGKIARPARGTARTSDIARTARTFDVAGTPSGTPTGRRNTPVDRRPSPVTLPEMARISVRPAGSAGRAIATLNPTLFNKSKTVSFPTAAKVDNPRGAPHFLKTGSVSLYGGPELVTNHYYGLSYSSGVRLTLPFSRHWSVIVGFEYSRVNVPKQIVPPLGSYPYDSLYAFYFSNYEVPVLFGYTSTFGRSSLTVNAGAILNLYYHKSTGVWVHNWPDRDSYGAVLGVDYAYFLGRSLALFAQPYERYSISNDRMFIPQQRASTGILLGIRYQL